LELVSRFQKTSYLSRNGCVETFFELEALLTR